MSIVSFVAGTKTPEARLKAPSGVSLASLAVQAAAPMLPPKRTDGALTEILPPFGTNPPLGRPVVTGPSDLSARTIHSDPRELWYLALPYKLTPKQVLQILRAALGGDIWQQWQLCSLMLDSWPRLRKCSNEIRGEVAGVRLAVQPYVEEPGEEPTPEAVERASLVRRAMNSYRPIPTTDEKGHRGLVYDLTDAILMGISMVELMWQEKVSRRFGKEILPRASAWVHPRHYTFQNDGQLVVFDAEYNRLNWARAENKAGSGLQLGKFIIGQYTSRSGSSLGAGLMRPLAWYWSAVVFCKEWMLQAAQKYGAPFMWANYKAGTPDPELAKLKQFMAEAQACGWGMFVEGTTVNVTPAQSLGSSNAQYDLMRQADEACTELLLGQTGTTQSVPGKLGGEDTHAKVKRENVEAVASWVAATLTEQFATAVLMMNYGDDDMCPTIEPDYSESPDPQAQASRDVTILNAGVPMNADEFYRANNLLMPKPGELVLQGGKLVKMGTIKSEEELAAEALAAQQQAMKGLGKEGEEAPPAKEEEEPEESEESEKEEAEEPEEEEKEEEVAARDDKYRVLVKFASDDDLDELDQLLAKAAVGRNGEWDAVQAKLTQMQRRNVM